MSDLNGKVAVVTGASKGTAGVPPSSVVNWGRLRSSIGSRRASCE